jgi:excisionase family DNA binding protein
VEITLIFVMDALHPIFMLPAQRRFLKIMETISKNEKSHEKTERLAYSLQEAADMLGVHYFSVYRLVQKGKLRACRALRG